MNILRSVLFYIIALSVLLLSVRGAAGSPEKTNINSEYWKENGPFELSPERGRFALTFSLVEDRSFQFDVPVARFALPDLGYIDGEYVSLFAPGVSFLIVPGYLLGKIFGASQLGSFAVISLFAILNVFLINAIAKKLGVKETYSMIGALSFLFASPAFAYAVSLYQHHISTFFVLAGVYVYLRMKGPISLGIIWFLVALSIVVDFPNFFMMLPLMILAILKIFEIQEFSNVIKIRFRFVNLLSVFGVVLPFVFLGWVNFKSYSDPFRLAGTVENVREIDNQGFPERNLPGNSTQLEEFRDGERESSSVALGFFNSRNISNGLYIHFLSPDRGIIYFAPFLLFSVAGAYLLYKKHPSALNLLLGVALINIIIYSMWGDPWGGWAFGSRYLIPSYAMGCILLAFGMERFFKKKLVKILFLVFLIYSVFVNTLGALTTNANPPKIEVLSLEEQSGKEEKYTYERNWDYLNTGGSKSFVYQYMLKNLMSPVDFYLFVSFFISLFLTGLVFWGNVLPVIAGKMQPFILKQNSPENVISERKSVFYLIKKLVGSIKRQ